MWYVQKRRFRGALLYQNSAQFFRRDSTLYRKRTLQCEVCHKASPRAQKRARNKPEPFAHVFGVGFIDAHRVTIQPTFSFESRPTILPPVTGMAWWVSVRMRVFCLFWSALLVNKSKGLNCLFRAYYTAGAHYEVVE